MMNNKFYYFDQVGLLDSQDNLNVDFICEKLFIQIIYSSTYIFVTS